MDRSKKRLPTKPLFTRLLDKDDLQKVTGGADVMMPKISGTPDVMMPKIS